MLSVHIYWSSIVAMCVLWCSRPGAPGGMCPLVRVMLLADHPTSSQLVMSSSQFSIRFSAEVTTTYLCDHIGTTAALMRPSCALHQFTEVEVPLKLFRNTLHNLESHTDQQVHIRSKCKAYHQNRTIKGLSLTPFA
jgi:hypothetical protein